MNLNKISKDMTKNYCGNVVYDSGERMLLTDEGYVTFAADGTPQYHYYLKDHLGNVRVVMGQAGAVEQVNHYYAFGSLMRESTNPGVQPYKYGGKELDRYSGLDAYDFGARAYFSDRMQWSTIDPMCEKYYDVSPYVYCKNNPVRFIDPDGRKPGDIFTSVDDAAVNFGRIYNYHSIVDKGEYAGVLYRFKNEDGNYSYTYAVSGKQSPSSCKYDKVDVSVLPKGIQIEIVGTIHSHADYDDIEGNPLRHEGNVFSDTDIELNKKFHEKNPSMTDFYVCTTNGHLLKHWYNKDENRWYNIKFNADKYKLPSDPNDPSHNEYTINAINAKVPFWKIRPLMDFDAYLENQEYK